MKITVLGAFVFLFFLACLPTLSAQNNTYRTIKVKGKVTLPAKGKNKPIQLQPDKIFKITDRLTFGSIQDFTVVVDDKHGAFLLRPDSTLRKYQSIPIPLGIDTRPGYILSDLQLRQFLNENDSLLLIGGRFSLVLGKEAFPMDDNHFFYLQFNWKGESINKKLEFHGDTLIIDEKEIYKVDGRAIDPSEVSGDFFLWYFIADKQESIAYPNMLKPVHLVNVREADITAEVRVLLDEWEKQPFNEQLKSIINYLALFYGRTGEVELEHWLQELKR